MEKLFDIHVCEHGVSGWTGQHLGGEPSGATGLPQLESAFIRVVFGFGFAFGFT